jgi:ATP-dependent RNA helicase DDX31/DBP7
MADDGLLLNFSVGNDAPAAYKPSYKGGHWRERLRLKTSSRRPSSGRNGARPQQRQTEYGDGAPQPPRKKLRTESEGEGFSRAQPDTAPREIISSLFTYNPAAQTEAPVEDDVPEAEVVPSNAPMVDGMDTFTSLGLSPLLAAHLLTKMELKAPTAIQKSAIEQLTGEDADAFIQAETGSGKTLAYLLPIVNRIIEVSKHSRPRSQDTEDSQIHRDSGLFAIILAPTRELSKQISVVLERLLRCAHWIVAGTVIGGESKKSEKARLRKGLNILVATPGRLVDHLSNTESLDISCVRWLVLDEGDRLMELGFEDDIRTVLTALDKRFRKPKRDLPGLPDHRVSILCSATMKMNVEKLGEMSLKDAVHLQGGPSDEGAADDVQQAFSAPAQLKQSYIIVPPKQRYVTLAALLKRTFARKGSVMKAMVFVSCADSVDFHFTALSRLVETDESASDSATEVRVATISKKAADSKKSSVTTEAPARTISSSTNPGLTIYKLHGSLAQPIRTSTLASFSKNPDPSILICTDVASRGLDLPSIDLVIEYDPAFSAEDHLHRIGRTARAGRDGRATIFLMPGPEEGYVNILKQSYKEDIGAKVTHTDADEILKRGFADDTPKSSQKPAKPIQQRHWEDVATDFQLAVERWVIEDEKAGEMAKKAYISHVRAYATHTISERSMFDIKSLHLGHLAKAFALRDKPGHMGRNSTKDKKGADRRRVHKKGGNDGDDSDDGRTQKQIDQQEASRKMRATMKMHMNAASEFNLG